MAATAASPRTLGTRADLTVPLAVIGGGFVALFGVTALLRARFPYALEWMEGPVAQHIEWARHGRSVYGPPNAEFTALNYPPLYYYLAAPFQALAPRSLLPLRLLSIAATLGSLALVAAFVQRETGKRTASLIGAGIVAAGFSVTGAFYDLVRIDAVALLLLLGGLTLVRLSETPRTAVLAGLLLAAAVFTKQVALLPSAAAVLWLAIEGRRVVVAYLGALAGTLTLLAALFERTSDGWFIFYVRDVASAHGVIASRIIGFWTSSFLPLLAPALVVSVAVLWRAHRLDDAVLVRFHAPVWFSMILATYGVAVHDGAYLNTLITAVVPLAVLSGIAVARHPRKVAVGLAVATQFVLLAYDPRPLVPSSNDRAAADEVVTRLRSITGPVLMPSDPWYLARAGRPMNASSVAIADVAGADPKLAAPVRRELDEMCAGRIAFVVPDPVERLGDMCGPCLDDARVIAEFDERAYPPTGARTAPASIVRPRRGC